MSATTYTWLANTTGDWSVAADWGGDAIPNSDTAVVNIAAGTGTVTVGSSESFAVQSLTMASGTLDLNGSVTGGPVTETGGAIALFGANRTLAAGYTLTAGELALGAGLLSLGGSAIFGPGGNGIGGEIDGPGTIQTTGTTTIGPGTGGGATGVDQLILGGGVTWRNSGIATIAGQVEFGDASGTTAAFINDAGAVLDFATDTGSLAAEANNSGTPIATATLVNDGLLEKTGGFGVSDIDAFVTGSGTIDVASGTLQLNGGGIFTGTIEGSGTLALGGGLFDLSQATISKNMEINDADSLDGRTLEVAGLSTFGSQLDSGPNGDGGIFLQFPMPVIDGPGVWWTAGTVDIYGVLYTEGPGVVAGNESVSREVVTSNSVLSEAGTEYVFLTLAGGLLWRNTGTVNLDGAILVDGAIENDRGGVIDLGGKVPRIYEIDTGNGDSWVNFIEGAAIENYDNDPNSFTLTNAGLLAGVGIIASTVTNTGTISAGPGGDMEFDAGGTVGGVIAGPGTVVFAGGTADLTGATALTNGGLLVDGAEVLLPEFDTTYDAPITVTSGTLVLGANLAAESGAFSATPTSDTVLQLGIFTLALSGAASFSGSGNYVVVDGAGTAAMNGTLATAGTTTLTVDGGIYAIGLGGGATWSNTGTVNTSTPVLIGDASGSTAAIVNAAGGVFDLLKDAAGIADINYYVGSTNFIGSSTFTNAGLLEKTGGTGVSTIDAVMNSTGIIDIADGTMAFSNGGTFTGTITGAGTAAFTGGIADLSSLSDFSAGGLVVSGATVSIQGFPTPYTGSINVTSGSLTLTSGLTDTGPISIGGTGDVVSVTTGGALVESGPFTMLGGATLTLGGDFTGSGTFSTSNANSTGSPELLSLSGHTLALSGSVTVSGYGAMFSIDGSGALTTSATTTLATANGQTAFGLAGGVAWTNTGTVNAGSGILIGDASGSAAAIFNAAGAVFDLSTDTSGITDNSYYVSPTNFIGSSTFDNAGLLAKVGGTGTSTIAAVMTNTGIIDIAGGTVQFNAGGTFDGTIEGAGTVAFAGGTAPLSSLSAFSTGGLVVSGATVSMPGFFTSYAGSINVVSGSLALASGLNDMGSFSIGNGIGAVASVTIGGALTESGTFNLGSSGTLTLGGDFTGTGPFNGSFTTSYSLVRLAGYTMTLSSSVSIVEASGWYLSIDGAGSLTTSGTTGLATDAGHAYALALAGGVTWTNTGTVNAASGILIGDASGSTAAIFNAAGAVFDLSTDTSGITDNSYYVSPTNFIGSSTFDNAGLLAKVGGTGTSTIAAVMTNTGIIDIAGGTVQFNAGGTFDGTIEGAGTVAFAGGTAPLSSLSAFSTGGLVVSGATVSMPGFFTSYAGSINVVSGSLALASGLNDMGSFSIGNGIGAVASVTIGGALTESGTFNLGSSGTLTLGGDFTGTGPFNGSFTTSYSLVRLAGYTMTLSSSVSIVEASGWYLSIDGAGSLTTSGTTGLATDAGHAYALALAGGVTWTNTGTVNAASGILIGDASGSTAAIFNAAGAVFDLSTDTSGITDNSYYVSPTNFIGSSTFDNAGLLAKVGGTGTSTIAAVMTNTGIIDIAGGTVQFNAGGTFDGTIEGAGTVAFAGGTAPLSSLSAFSTGGLVVSGATVSMPSFFTSYAGSINVVSGSLALASGLNDMGSFSIGNGIGAVASVTIGGALTESGTFNLGSSGTLTLGGDFTGTGPFNGSFTTSYSLVRLAGYTMTLSSSVSIVEASGWYLSIDGAGSLTTSGTTGLATDAGHAYALAFAGGVTWTNTGTVNAASGILIGDASGSTAAIFNAAGAVFDLSTDTSGITDNSYYVSPTNFIGSSTFDNAGLLAKVGGTGTSTIAAVMTNTGIIDIAGGTVQFNAGGTFDGTIEGVGTVAFAGGTATLAAGLTLSAGGIVITGGTVLEANTLSPTAPIALNAGSLRLAGGTITDSGLAIGATSRVFGFGTLTTPETNGNFIEADGGNLKINGVLTGTGGLEIDPGATLELNTPTAETVALLGQNATLRMDAPASYTGTIASFSITDAIVLDGVSASGAVLANGTMTVSIAGSGTLAWAVTGGFTGELLNVAVNDGATTIAPLYHPTIGGTEAGQMVSDSATIDPFSSVTISDLVSNATETLTVTPSAAVDGILTNLGGGSYNAGVYTDVGTAAQVAAAIDGLVFTPTEHQVGPGQTVTTGFTIQDTNSLADMATDSTTTVIAIAGTVLPTIGGAVPGQDVIDEATISPLSNVTIEDQNFGQTETVTVTISAAANGMLANLDGGTFNAAKGVYTAEGTAAQVTAALDRLVFIPTAHQVAPEQTVVTGFTILDVDTAGASASDSTTTVIATAVPPRTLVWSGSAGTSFANPSNWDDTTLGLDPAALAPGDTDTVDFNAIGGAVAGTGTVATLDVGATGSAALQLTGGTTLVAGSLDAGIVASSAANINLSGTGTNLDIANTAVLADDGTGVLSVLSGATFAAANLTIGSQGDSSGAVVVSGAGSVVNVSGDLNVGTSLGIGDLTIGPGAVVNALVVKLQGEVVLEGGELDPTVNLINQGQTAGGSGTIAAGDIVDEGVIQAGGSKPSQKLLVVAGTILGGGPWTINGSVQAQANGNVGILQINSGGTLDLAGPVLNAGSTTFTDDVTPQSTYTVSDSVVDVNFGDATGVLKLDDIGGFAGTIAAFRKGDEFNITGGTLSNLGVTGGNTLTVSDSGNGGTDQLIFASPVSASGFSIVNNNTIQVACFAAGTWITTANGPVAVENLRVGEHVVTNEGCGEPIIWIGRRTVSCSRHPAPEAVWPVRVRAGAFGENVPARDLYLSPDHAVFVNEVLVPVKLLINDTSIAWVKRSKVTYYHVELPTHAVILAEGLTVESYLDVGDRANFEDATTIRLYSDFGPKLSPETAMAWETRGAAPLVMAGEQLTAARRVVMENAKRYWPRSLGATSKAA